MTGAVWSSGERIVRKETEAAIEEMQKQAENRQEEAASGTESKDSAADTTGFGSNTPAAETNHPDVPSSGADTSSISYVTNPYVDSFLANQDMAAWLQIEGTRIDYPVMWTPEDEIYYLYRDFSGQDNKDGCLILDTDSSLNPLTTNLIIHGHNMRSGSMFGTLTDYEKESYCREHNIIKLYTPECERRYEVLAVFRSQVFKTTYTGFKFYKFFQANTQEEFDDFYNNIKALSLYDTGVEAEFGDHFITLSTCVYHVEQGRFVVVAKEIEPGDSYLPFR